MEKQQAHNGRNALLFNVFNAYSVAGHLVFKQIYDQAVVPERGLIPLSVACTQQNICALQLTDTLSMSVVIAPTMF